MDLLREGVAIASLTWTGNLHDLQTRVSLYIDTSSRILVLYLGHTIVHLVLLLSFLPEET